MNPKFILPVSLALTAHVFLLFGLPGRTPVTVAPPLEEPLPPGKPLPALILDEPIRERGDGEDHENTAGPGGPVAPRLPDVPLVGPNLPDFTVPALPPIAPGDGITQISSTWIDDRETRGRVPTGILTSDQLDRVPRARVQPPPTYPGDMRDLGVEGSVVVEFLVDEAGNAYNPMVVRASRREFEAPALRAVARWKFEPGMKDGRRVRFRMSVPVVFKLAGK